MDKQREHSQFQDGKEHEHQFEISTTGYGLESAANEVEVKTLNKTNPDHHSCGGL